MGKGVNMLGVYIVCFMGGIALGLVYGEDTLHEVGQWLRRKFLCAVSKKARLYYTQLDIDDKLDDERCRAAMKRAWRCILERAIECCEEEEDE